MKSPITTLSFKLSGHTKATVIIVCCGALISLLNQTLISPALPAIMQDLDIMPSTAQWVTTSFMLVSAVITPINALILEKFSLRCVYSWGFAIFLCGSFVMGVAQNFQIMLTGRILQALGAGVLVPTAIATMLIIYPKQHRGSAMGVYGSITGVGIAIGPSLSGFLVTFLSWRYIFLTVAGVSLLFMIFGIAYIRNVDFAKSSKTADLASLVFCFIGFALLVYALSSLRPDSLNHLVLACLAIGFVLVVLFINRQLKIENPILNLHVFKQKQFRIGTIIMVFVYGSGMCNSILLPILIQDCYLQSAIVSGFVVLPGAVLAIFLNPSIGKVFDKYGIRRLAILSGAVTTASCIALCWPSPDLPIVYIIVIWSFRNVALIIFLRILPTWAINSLQKDDVAHGNAIQSTSQQVFGALFTALFISIFEIVASNCQTLFSCAENPVIYSSIMGINIVFAIQAFISLVATIYIVIKVR